MSRRALIGIGVALLVVIGVGVGISIRPQSTARAAPEVGHPAPALALRTLGGKRMVLASQRGHVVLINFWATWCVPCAKEMPAIERVFRSQHRGLTVLAVDYEPAADIRTYARRHGLTFTFLLDPSNATFDRYRVVVQPESFWIDPAGIIRAIHYGPMNAAYVRRELNRLSR